MATVQTTASVTDINKITGLQSTAAAIDAKAAEPTVQTAVPLGALFTDTVYTHPTNHPASIIEQDLNNRFVTDSEKSAWSGKAEITAVTTLANGLMIASDKTKLDAISGTNTGDQDLSAYALTADVHNMNSGGTAGQVLAKIDSTDFNTQWVTPSSGSSVSYISNTITSGRIYRLVNCELSTSTTINQSTNINFCYPFILDTDMDINALGLEVFSTTGAFECAIYNNSTTTIRPSTVLVQAPSVTVTASGFLFGSIATTTLIAGTVYWAVVRSSTSVNARTNSSLTSFYPNLMKIFGGDSTIGNNFGMAITGTMGADLTASTITAMKMTMHQMIVLKA